MNSSTTHIEAEVASETQVHDLSPNSYARGITTGVIEKRKGKFFRFHPAKSKKQVDFILLKLQEQDRREDLEKMRKLSLRERFAKLSR